MICIINYRLGNIRSLVKAFNKMGGEIVVSEKISDIRNAKKLVLPGVGSFERGMENLGKIGLISVLKEQILMKKKPILGICLGMQLMFRNSEEDGFTEGLGFINGKVKKFTFDSASELKSPHMGWNNVFGENLNSIKIFEGVGENSNFYFVHSYHALLNENINCGYTDYGYSFVSVIQKNNIYGTQFHPEKSQKEGLKIIKNFILL